MATNQSLVFKIQAVDDADALAGEGALRQRVAEAVGRLRAFFATGKTKEVAYRVAQLRLLDQALTANEDRLLAALASDMSKPKLEAYVSEISMVRDELRHAIRRVAAWTRPRRVRTSLLHMGASSEVRPEPLGVALIISPWNYPVQLLLGPLVGALAAGNCAVLKPSEMTPATSQVLADMVKTALDPRCVEVFEGGVETAQALLAERFDHIFFTGSAGVGRIILRAAAQHLTPVTLELGGKSPVIVDVDVDLDQAAKRIAWGKFFNAGQTCVAPDYALVPRGQVEAFAAAIGKWIQTFYGQKPELSPDYARIINAKHFQRLTGYLNQGRAVVGGTVRPNELYIAPTVLLDPALDAPVMQEEIFGPVLPVVAYDGLDEAVSFVTQRPKPLALYVFTRNRETAQRVLDRTSSGGVVVNDSVLQVTSKHLPFGGVGDSGFGAYHGKTGFDAFSHHKSVMTKRLWALTDIFLRYPPYAYKLPLLKPLIRLFGY